GSPSGQSALPRAAGNLPRMPGASFEVICEIEPATRPDLTRVRHQIGVLSTVASAFLVPDNHIGRATVSSIAVAHEVERVRTFCETPAMRGRAMRAAVASGLGPLPGWKREADAVFVQVSWDVDELARWRESVRFDGPVYAGVMVLASAAMGRKLGADVPQLAAPASWIEAVERDAGAGVD